VIGREPGAQVNPINKATVEGYSPETPPKLD